MSDDSKSPLDIALEAMREGELEALRQRYGGDLRAAELRALSVKPAKQKRRRADFHALTVIDGGRKD